MTNKKLLTANELLKRYNGKFVDAYPRHFDKQDKNGKWITVYEIRGVSKTIKENFQTPEEIIN